MRRYLRAFYHGLSLQHRLSMQVSAALVVVFVILGLLGHYAVKADEADILRDRLVFARTTASYLDNELREELRAMGGLAEDMTGDLASGAGPSRWSDRLLQYLEPFTVYVALLDANRQVIWTSPMAPAPSRTVIDSVRPSLPGPGGYFISRAFALDAQQTPAVSIAIPVQGKRGEPAGWLVTAINPMHAHFNQFLTSASRLGNTVQGELMDDTGRVVSASRSGLTLEPAPSSDLLVAMLQRQDSRVETLPPGAPGADPQVAAFVTLEMAHWGLVVSGSAAEAFAADRAWTWAVAVAGSLGLLAALLLIWLAVRSVAQPIQALTVAARRISTGDLSEPIPAMGNGEVRQLAQAFDSMRQRLAGSYHDLAVRTGQYEATIRSMTDALITMDTSGRITSLNPAAQTLLGREANELLGRHCSEVLPCSGPGGSGCAACPLPAGAAASAISTQVLLNSEGRSLTVAVARSLTLTDDGQPAGVVLVMRDISAEADLNRLKDEFVSTVFHELRTPLGFIKGYTTTLLRRDTNWSPRYVRHFLRVIDQASDDLEEYIDNLLDLSKIGAGALRISPQPTSLPVLARRLVRRFRPRCRGHATLCQFPRVFPLVWADPRRLDQILHNLLDNAIKYSPAGGTILIRGQWRDGEAVISVSDEGPGIPPQEHELVFQRFYRGQAATGVPIGSGLGLAICRGVVEAHGGRIWVEPDQALGACISFCLPLDDAKEEDQVQ